MARLGHWPDRNPAVQQPPAAVRCVILHWRRPAAPHVDSERFRFSPRTFRTSAGESSIIAKKHRYRRVGTRAHYFDACRPLGGLTISECDNEDQIRAISAKSFPVGSSKLAHNGRQKLAVCHPQHLGRHSCGGRGNSRCAGNLVGPLKPGHAGGGAAQRRKRPAMTDDWRRQLTRARRIPFAKLAIVAVMIAGAALASACSQPSDSQQTAQQQASDEQGRKEADEKAWADAEKAGTAAAYTAYIQSFGGGAHVAEARQRVAELSRKEADDKAWADAVRAGTAAALTVYTQNFSSGAHVAEARQRLAALDEQARKEADEKAWAAAEKAGTAAAFTDYIQKFGSGAHVAEARQRLATLDEQARKEADEKAWADAEKAGTATAFTGYVQTFGSGAHVAEARQRAAALETQGRKEVPAIDVQKTCKAAAGVMVSLM